MISFAMIPLLKSGAWCVVRDRKNCESQAASLIANHASRITHH
jgi:hypothetical protein